MVPTRLCGRDWEKLGTAPWSGDEPMMGEPGREETSGGLGRAVGKMERYMDTMLNDCSRKISIQRFR